MKISECKVKAMISKASSYAKSSADYATNNSARVQAIKCQQILDILLGMIDFEEN